MHVAETVFLVALENGGRELWTESAVDATEVVEEFAGLIQWVFVVYVCHEVTVATLIAGR